MRDFRAVVGTALVLFLVNACLASEESSLTVLKAPAYFQYDTSADSLSASRLSDLFLTISGFPIDKVKFVSGNLWGGIVNKG